MPYFISVSVFKIMHIMDIYTSALIGALFLLLVPATLFSITIVVST